MKAIGGLIIVALAFIVVAIVAGGGSDHARSETAGPSNEEAGTLESAPTAAGNNTTRIEGRDAATLAANIAFTVFPSATPAQRPESVTLTGEEWQNAVAAAVFMANPLRAPMLISAAGGMPEVTSRALETLHPSGNKLKPVGNATTQGVPYYVVGPIATPDLGRTNKTGETVGAPQAAAIEAFRKTLFREAPHRVIVVSEDDAAFAVPAAAWAARSGDPILYSHTDSLPKATIAALKDFPPTSVYVLGPPSVISPSVMHELSHYTRRLKRISGKTPTENAIAFARYSDRSFGWNINDPGHGFVIARSDRPLEAALSVPLSASGSWGPLLLTESADKLPAALRKYLLDVKPGYTTDPTRAFYNHVWIIGGKDEVSSGQQAEINQLAELAKVEER